MHMLHSRRKAEIEIIQSLPPGSFCPGKLIETQISKAAKRSADLKHAILLNNPLADYVAAKILERISISC